MGFGWATLGTLYTTMPETFLWLPDIELISRWSSCIASVSNGSKGRARISRDGVLEFLTNRYEGFWKGEGRRLA